MYRSMCMFRAFTIQTFRSRYQFSVTTVFLFTSVFFRILKKPKVFLACFLRCPRYYSTINQTNTVTKKCHLATYSICTVGHKDRQLLADYHILFFMFFYHLDRFFSMVFFLFYYITAGDGDWQLHSSGLHSKAWGAHPSQLHCLHWQVSRQILK